MHGNTRYVVWWTYTDADVFPPLYQRRRRTRSATRAAVGNAGHPRAVATPDNRYAIIAAVKREPWESTRHIAGELGAFQPVVPQGLR